MSGTKRKLSATNTTGYRGVSRNGHKFTATHKNKYLGMYATAKQAAIAYDRAALQHKRPTSHFNFPDGIPNDDGEDDDAIVQPRKKKRRRLQSRNTSGYTGVYKKGERFRADITIDRNKISLGTYDTPKEAAFAYDRAIVQYKRPFSKLNFPDGLSIDDEDYNELMHPTEKKRLHSRNTTGYTGVYKTKSNRRFIAKLRIDGKQEYLGIYGTPKEAALAYDCAVIHHKLPSSKLNFPQDYEYDYDYTSSDEERDDGHRSDDEATLEFGASSQGQAPASFQRTSMLEQLACVAEQEFQEP